ncbi:unnamed protein product [Periconia digitata]|uniref:Uncharacterized protein n=1 Tax=Periconia digitata TaxID=1303443 RepID=A0A9W4U9Z5_9PLEO|nr:unnamed protein product [Periconia digitata]
MSIHKSSGQIDHVYPASSFDLSVIDFPGCFRCPFLPSWNMSLYLIPEYLCYFYCLGSANTIYGMSTSSDIFNPVSDVIEGEDSGEKSLLVVAIGVIQS